MPTSGEVTQLLHRLDRGDEAALERLMPLLYDELRMVARKQLRRERRNHTLGTTALVNEAYLKLVGQQRLKAEDRGRFFAIAATTMRRILIDYARARKRLKRGGEQTPVPLDEAEAFLTDREADEVLALDDALNRLAAVNPRGSQVVQYRFFSGLTLAETAEVMDVSVKTVQRAWVAARAWLRKEVAGELRLDP
jgi:RNA polymerase sigma factor (TIGR02999 family)